MEQQSSRRTLTALIVSAIALVTANGVCVWLLLGQGQAIQKLSESVGGIDSRLGREVELSAKARTATGERLSELTSGLDRLQRDANALTDQSSAIERLQRSVSEQVTLNTSRLDSLTTKADSQEKLAEETAKAVDRLDKLQGEQVRLVTAIKTGIETVNGGLKTVSTDVESVEASLLRETSELRASLNELDGKVDAQTAASSKLATAVSNAAQKNGEQVQTLAKSMDDLDGTVKQALDNIQTAAPPTAYTSAVLSVLAKIQDLEKAAGIQADRSTALSTEVSSAQKADTAKLQSLEQKVTSLDGTVQQALGKIYIAETPAEVAKAVDAALKDWLPDSKLQASPGDSDDLRTVLVSIREALPAGAEADLAGPMRRLEWWADTMELTEVKLEQTAQLPSLLQRAADLERAAPYRVPKWCFDQLRDYRRRSMAIAAAQACEDAFSTMSGADETRMLLDAALDLQPKGSTEQVKLEELRKLFAEKFPAREGVEGQLASIKQQREAAKLTSDPELRLQLLIGLDAQATGLLSECDASNLGQIETQVKALRAETAKIAKDTQDRQWLAYQKYALQWITSARDSIAEHRPGAFSSGDPEKVASALYSSLGDIDPALLDQALAQEFNTVWSSGWDALGSDTYRKQEVLRKIGATVKKRLGEV
jgi:hypothetical protein